jgi:hypothetical protein
MQKFVLLYASAYRGAIGLKSGPDTFNQVGIDATHIKLVEDPFWISILDLGKVVGKIKAEIIDYQATCMNDIHH